MSSFSFGNGGFGASSTGEHNCAVSDSVYHVFFLFHASGTNDSKSYRSATPPTVLVYMHILDCDCGGRCVVLRTTLFFLCRNRAPRRGAARAF